MCITITSILGISTKAYSYITPPIKIISSIWVLPLFSVFYIVLELLLQMERSLLLLSSPGAAGRRPVEDLQTFWCCALHQGPAGLHAPGQDTGQCFDWAPPSNSCPWLHMTFCFVPLFPSIKVRASRIQSWPNVHREADRLTNMEGITVHPRCGFCCCTTSIRSLK